ncbi:hypothetical protein Scep_004613 [Stephania cephalantha]|uniref:Uncharacterized protein n=1 Tax=Stephania cephalantha TaxID=152367 RepID=A0AAP0KVN2_9MAGN
MDGGGGGVFVLVGLRHSEARSNTVRLRYDTYKAREAPKESEQEKENTGAAKDDSTDLPGQQLAIRMSQTNAMEPSSSDATESDREKKEKVMRTEILTEKMEKVEKEMKWKWKWKWQCEGNNKGDEGEEGQDSEEEVVGVRPSAKARGKAKSGPSDKVAADDMSKPFPGGPINQELLTSFNNHVTAAIWNKKCHTISRSEALELVSSTLDEPEKEADQQLNMDLKVNEALLTGKWGCKPTSSLKGKQKKMAVDVIKAWKALPPRESDKAAAMKMADEVLKLLMMFGSPTPSQPNNTLAEGASSSKRKPTTSAPSPFATNWKEG